MIFIIIVLILTSIIDFKKHIIPNTSCILLLLNSLYLAYTYRISFKIPILLFVSTLLLLSFLVLTMEQLTKQYVMGGGDIKLLSALTSCIGIEQMVIVLLSLSIMLLIILLFKKNRQPLALAPLIFVGYIVSCIL